MDVKNRKIIDWSLNSSRTVELSITTLKQAFKHRKPNVGMIFHTDRGVKYTAYRFSDELKRHGTRYRINRADYCTDNSHMEPFFHSLKTGLIRSQTLKSEENLRRALKIYINHFITNNGYIYKLVISPIEYERITT